MSDHTGLIIALFLIVALTLLILLQAKANYEKWSIQLKINQDQAQIVKHLFEFIKTSEGLK